jgi:rhamnogalacturonyl hydrolase YesR
MGFRLQVRALILSAVAACAMTAEVQAQQALPESKSLIAAHESIPWRRADVISLAEKVGHYQLAAMAAGLKPNPAAPYPDPRGWEQGALFVGLMSLADHSSRPEFGDVIRARGQANDWRLGDRVYDADDHIIGSSYFWAARHGAGDTAIAPMRARLDDILAKPPVNDLTFVGNGSTCRDRWCWCDALFMAPPVWLEMSRVTGDPRYADYAKREFRATTDSLYDPASHLYFRDSRFFERRDINGKKLFWSRGNGWVFGGLPRMISLLPEGDADRTYMEGIFKQMAATLIGLQKPDGFWSPSLLGDPAVSLPESSGTGFYTFGLAWGIKSGLLDRSTYEPHVRRGWAALVRSVQADGKLGYVQPVSDRPDAVGYDDTQLYGVGAFLLAAGEMAELDLSAPPVSVSLEVHNPSRLDQGAAVAQIALALPESKAGGWSAEAGGAVYPAQYEGGVLSFVMPLKAQQTVRVSVRPQPARLPERVHAILNVQDGGALDGGVLKGGTFHLRKSYQVPADHFVHDGLIAFEGVGWESDKVAYRLYLDGRNVTDIYGKKLPGPILQSIGQNVGDYHAMSDWGQDIYQVGTSLGIGGIGVVRNGRAEQIGPSAIAAEVANTAITGEATVSHSVFDAGGGSLRASYKIRHGQALTFVDAVATGSVSPVATGFRHHPGVSLLRGGEPEAWSYFASWGQQALTNDNLGLAIFFKSSDTHDDVRDDGQSYFVTFKDPRHVKYAFAATWVQDNSGVRNLNGFQTWLDATVDGLNHPLVVKLLSKHSNH